MRVLKFGGTSLADSERFLSVSDIVVNSHRKSQVALVLSAPARVTNLLVSLVEEAVKGNSCKEEVEEIISVYKGILKGVKEKYSTLNDAMIVQKIEEEFSLVKKRIEGIVLLGHGRIT